MNLHLLVPSLFWPDATLTAIYRDLPLPALESLLAKSSCNDDGPQEFEAWLCQTFKVAKQLDWPIAPITLMLDGAERIRAGDDYWVRADPVHLQIERDQLILADSRVFPISSEEANQFTGLLNRHFVASGQKIVFFPLQPDRWYLRAEEMPLARTHLLGEVANKGINELLPYNANQAIWRGLFNEIQMLLHEHPLNHSREARGEPAINSVWFWGGGTMPQSMASPYTHVWTDDVIAGSLAQACDTDHARLPPDAKTWLEHATSGNHLAVLDVLRGKTQYADAYGWRESLKNLERNWFEPLLAMVRQGRIDHLTLTVISATKTRNFTARAGDLRKFWRRAKPISAYNH